MTETVGAPPSIFLHTAEVYERMENQAEIELVGSDEVLIWSGYMTKLITGPPMNLPIPYYTQITGALKGMGCAQQLKRGGGTAESRWALFRAPTTELYNAYETRTVKRPARSKTAQNEQRIADIASRMDAVEAVVQELLLLAQD